MDNNLCFPLTKAVRNDEKFPFRSIKHYTNPNDSEPDSFEVMKSRMGYTAQKSIERLERMGRKPAIWYFCPSY
ncbi:CLUMA_CG004823, isoform A [Clunio marinus]|uniref:CLUMA_CG004823, isoform A n=1 Tax=Clunio marinus TaxID=568069 RepID=A0A1J1HYC6_9DIPT|nr:CLUMA_CG004823, isoform A [Clunio marinus]